ncbi:MAG: hypothetical protein K5868_01605 [Lachnospiraceae bacterium]|nr:hypothetical protein [Lachnospiraceae bacterium]
MYSGVKTSGMSPISLMKALSDNMGISNTDDTLSKVDHSTGTLFCATIEDASMDMLQDAIANFEAEAKISKSQAEAAIVPATAKNFTKKSTYAWFAAQAIKYYMTHKQ